MLLTIKVLLPLLKYIYPNKEFLIDFIIFLIEVLLLILEFFDIRKGIVNMKEECGLKKAIVGGSLTAQHNSYRIAFRRFESFFHHY